MRLRAGLGQYVEGASGGLASRRLVAAEKRHLQQTRLQVTEDVELVEQKLGLRRLGTPL